MIGVVFSFRKCKVIPLGLVAVLLADAPSFVFVLVSLGRHFVVVRPRRQIDFVIGPCVGDDGLKNGSALVFEFNRGVGHHSDEFALFVVAENPAMQDRTGGRGRG